MTNYAKPVAVYTISNTLGVVIFDIDHGSEQVLAAFNDDAPEWYPMAEQINDDASDDEELVEIGFTMGQKFIPFNLCMCV